MYSLIPGRLGGRYSSIPSTTAPSRKAQLLQGSDVLSQPRKSQRHRQRQSQRCIPRAFTSPPASESQIPEAPMKVPSTEGSRIPRCLAEIDNGKILGFGASLAEDHPVRPTFQPCSRKYRAHGLGYRV